MSVIDEVLQEEYERSSRISAALEAELAGLPRGSIRERVIKGKPYYYLQFREGGHVRSRYVSRDEVGVLRSQLVRRKEVLAALKEQKESRKKIERALGKEFAHGLSASGQ